MATTQLIPNNLKLHQANQFIESFNENANTIYYMFAGKTSSVVGGGVPQEVDSFKTVQFGTYNTMLFGKHVLSTDTSLMVNRNLWTSNTVYAKYDDTDGNLSTKQFYVYVLEGGTYYVYKCLNNNGEAASTSIPTFSDTSASDDYYQTSDGYQWKYLYKLTTAQFDKFSTGSYIPIVVDSNTTSNAINGCIDVILVSSSGLNYNNYLSGQFSSGSVVNSNYPVCAVSSSGSTVNNFYTGCYLYITGGTGVGQYKEVVDYISNTSGRYVILESKFVTVPDNTSTYDINPKVIISGDSSQTINAVARAIVSNSSGNSISSIQMLNRGKNYLSAYASVYASPQVGVSGNASLRVIIPPKGGHGANIAMELYSSKVGVSVKFSNTETNTIPVANDYRSIGLIKDPMWSNVVFTVTSQNGTFTSGELVKQTIGNAVSSGYITSTSAGSLQLTNVYGFFVTGNSTVGSLVGQSSSANAIPTAIYVNGIQKSFETFDQRYTYGGSYQTGTTFTADEPVIVSGSVDTIVANAVFHSNNSSGNTVYLTQQFGLITTSNTLLGTTSGAVFNINTKYDPDLIIESGDVLYSENFDAVNRSSTQSETIKLILEY